MEGRQGIPIKKGHFKKICWEVTRFHMKEQAVIDRHRGEVSYSASYSKTSEVSQGVQIKLKKERGSI